MPLVSVAAMNASLDNDYGSSSGANSPASFTLHPLDGDPRDDGAEIVVDGITPPTLANNDTNFPAAVDGEKVCPAFDIGTPTVAGPTVRWWLLKDAATGDYWDACSLRRPVDLPAGTPAKLKPEIAYDPEAL